VRKGDPDEVQRLLAEANRLGDAEDAVIASAFVIAKTDWQQAIAALAMDHGCAAPTRVCL
jgi:hypothetical protein